MRERRGVSLWEFLLPRPTRGTDLGDVRTGLWAAVFAARHVIFLLLAVAAAVTPAVGPNRVWLALAVVVVVVPYDVALDVHLRRTGRLHPAMPYADLVLAAAFPLVEPRTWIPALLVGIADVALHAMGFHRATAAGAAAVGAVAFAAVALTSEPDGAVVGALAFPIASVLMVLTIGSVAEQARRSRHRFEALVAGLDAIVWEADPDTLAFTYVSPPAERILGHPPAVWLADPGFWLTLIHPEDRLRTVDLCRTAIADSRDHELVYRAMAADGRVVWVRDLVHVEVDDSGGPTALRGVMLDITAEKQAEGLLRHMAMHDALTGLPNRTLLHDRLERAVAEADRTGQPTALLLMDLDDFKEVNDTLGHHVGDLLLQQVAARLQDALRGSDTVARLGGDEFAILLTTDAGAEGAERVAHRVRAALRPPFDVAGVSLAVRSSIGIALYPQHGGDAAELVQRADVAMYRAKRAGIGHAVYRDSDDRAGAARLSLVSQMGEAVVNRSLEVHYQPIVAAEGGRPVGVEGLLRWPDHEYGALTHGELVELAEVSGRSEQLVAWLVAEAAGHARRWTDAGAVDWVAVNLGSAPVRTPRIAQRIAALLDQAGLPPDRLTIEVSERDLVRDPLQASQAVSAISALGIRTAIDDFGAGHASLAQLRRLAVHQVRVGRWLLGGLTSDAHDAVVARAVVELAHTLDLEVVAVGVDGAATAAAVGNLGFDLVQGRAVAPPASAAETELWLPSAGGRQRGPGSVAAG